MDSEVVLHQLPGKVPNERILVALSQNGPGWNIALHQQHWAEGIGWYDQKVMHFDARQWAAFRSVFSATLPSGMMPLPDVPESIPFPGPSEMADKLRRKASRA